MFVSIVMSIVLTLPSTLKVQQLTVDYRGVRGLDDVSFQIEPGQLVGIVGPNGAGKNTIMKAMLGLAPTISGQVIPLCIPGTGKAANQGLSR